MPPTILHVEDDLALRAVVKLTFQHLGFRGETMTASTVAQGERVLDEAAQDQRRFDLILSDMHLPDGTGLDLVKFVRDSPVWRVTPMLILSGDLDPKYVNRAYALGANAYIDKSPRGRSTSEVITALYRHWLIDVVPARADSGRSTMDTLARSMAIRLRFAEIYVRLADVLGKDASEAAFWLSRALGESNLANLFAFMRQQLDRTELGEPLMREIADVQQATESALAAFELDLQRSLSRDELYQRVMALLAAADVNVVAHCVAALSPVSPAAASAARDLFVAAIASTAAWIELHAESSTLRTQAGELRGTALVLSASAVPA